MVRLRNLFAIDFARGYQWWTVGWDRECADAWGWAKFGPVSFAWGALDGFRHFEVTVLGTSVWRVR